MKSIILLCLASLNILSMEMNQKVPYAFCEPQPFGLSISHSFSSQDQQDFQTCLELLHNRHSSAHDQDMALRILETLDLKYFCPAQLYLYEIFLLGLFNVSQNQEIASYYLQRACAAAYPPALFRQATELLKQASQIRWVPLLNEGKKLMYYPFQHKTAAFLFQTLCYHNQERMHLLTEQEEEITRKYAEFSTNQTTESATPTIEKNLNNPQAHLEQQQAGQSEISATTQENMANKNVWQSLKKHINPQNFSTILINFQKEYKKKDLKSLYNDMVDAGIFLELGKSSQSTEIAYVYGSILYKFLKELDVEIVEDLQRISGFHRDKKGFHTYIYHMFLFAQGCCKPDIFLQLAQMTPEHINRFHFLYCAYEYANNLDKNTLFPEKSPHLIRQSIIEQCKQYLSTEEPDHTGYALAIALKRKNLHQKHVIALLSGLSDPPYLIDIICNNYNLLENLIDFTQNSNSLKLKHEVGKFLYEKKYDDIAEALKYHKIAYDFLAQSKDLDIHNFEYTLTTFFSSDNQEHACIALTWFLEKARTCENKKLAAVLNNFFDQCKVKAKNDLFIALFVIEHLLHGITNVVKPNYNEAYPLIKRYCKKGFRNLLISLTKNITRLAEQEDNNSVIATLLDYWIRAFQSYLKRNPTAQEETLTDIFHECVEIMNVLPDKLAIHFGYKFTDIILPYDITLGETIFSQVDEHVRTLFDQNSTQDFSLLIQTTGLYERLKQYIEEDAELAISLYQALLWRCTKERSIIPQEDYFEEMRMCISAAQNKDPNLMDYEKLLMAVFSMEGSYQLKRRNYKESLRCFSIAKNDYPVSRALYGDILLSHSENIRPNSIEKYKEGIDAIESAISSCSYEEFKKIIPIMSNLACFYLEPPDDALEFKNVDRGIELMKLLATNKDPYAVSFIKTIDGNKRNFNILSEAKKLFEQKKFTCALEKFKEILEIEEALGYYSFCLFELENYADGISALFEFLEKTLIDKKSNLNIVNTGINYLLSILGNEPKQAYKTLGPTIFNKILSLMIKYIHFTGMKKDDECLECLTHIFEITLDILMNKMLDEKNMNISNEIKEALQNDVIDEFQKIAIHFKASNHLFRICKMLYNLYLSQHNRKKNASEPLIINQQLLKKTAEFAENTLQLNKGLGDSDENKQIFSGIYQLYGQYLETEGKKMEALAFYTKALAFNDKNPAALLHRGMIILQEKADTKKAFKDLEKAAQTNYKKAQTTLGRLLIYGGQCLKNNPPIKIDPMRGLKLLRSAGEGKEGDIEAFYVLGRVYLYGTQEIAPNIKLARLYLHKAYKSVKKKDPFDLAMACTEYAKTKKPYELECLVNINEAITNFKASNNILASLMLAQIYLMNKNSIEQSLAYFTHFFEGIKITNDIIIAIEKTELHKQLEEKCSSSLEYSLYYAFALEAYKKALYALETKNWDIFFEKSKDLQKNLKKIAPKIDKNNNEDMNLFSILYAASYFLLLFGKDNIFTDEQITKLGIQFALRSVNKDAFNNSNDKMNYVIVRLQEIKNIIRLLPNNKQILIQQHYNKIIVDHKDNVIHLSDIFCLQK